MSRVPTVLFALALAASPVVAACGAPTAPPTAPVAAQPPPQQPPGDPIVDRVGEYARRMCECKDAACIEKLDEDLSAWADAHTDELRERFHDPVRKVELERHDERMGACRGGLVGDGGSHDGAGAEPVLASMSTMADELCACTDVACSDAVMHRLATLDQPTVRPTTEQMERAMKIAEKMVECQKRLTDGATAGVSSSAVRAPVADDLAVYLANVKGRGTGTLTATIATSMGAFHCELFERDAPLAVANFVGLATGQKPFTDPRTGAEAQRPFYDGLEFHRVIPGFMIQGGDPLGTGIGGPGYGFETEVAADRRHDGAGVLSMANAGPGTNGSQFFITEKATPWLDGKHTVFGRCREGKLVKKITALHGRGDRPKKPVTIKRVTIERR
jgi:peptidyl-prolyl cis-trans isomerase A (cyclophilin A)